MSCNDCILLVEAQLGRISAKIMSVQILCKKDIYFIKKMPLVILFICARNEKRLHKGPN